MRLADELQSISADHLSETAWIERDHNSGVLRNWTWADIQSLTVSTVVFLAESSVESGDRIVNLGRNSLAWVVLDLACSALNAVHVPIDSRFSQHQQARCIELVEPKMVFSDAPVATGFHEVGQLLNLPQASMGLEHICRPFRWNDPANILFTSGTSGNPRGVMLSHKNLVSNAYAKLDAMPQHQGDHRLNFLPFSHAYARTCELTTWLVSRSSMEVARGIDDVLSKAKSVQPTLINGVPVFYNRLVDMWKRSGCTQQALHEILGTRIRRLASGGASLSDPIRAKFASVGIPIYQGYGLTESSPVICSNRTGDGDDTAILAEVGPPVKGVDIKIDADSRLWVAGDGVMLGYWRDPEATKARIVDHWLDTGDLAEFVADENSDHSNKTIRILGRADDAIVLSSGYKVHPFPIEQILNSQSWVSQCMLVGRNCPHTTLLIKLSASEALTSPAELQSRVEKLLGEFPRHAIPKKLHIVEEDWTSANGLANFKGGLIRNQIEARYGGQSCEPLLHEAKGERQRKSFHGL